MSIEKTIHKTITDEIQKISDQYGIKIGSINIFWVDVSSMSEEKHLITSLQMSTSSGNR